MEKRVAMCQIYPDLEATVKITYGLYSEFRGGRDHYEHNLSNKGAIEIWNKCAILVNQGDMHWKNEPIKKY